MYLLSNSIESTVEIILIHVLGLQPAFKHKSSYNQLFLLGKERKGRISNQSKIKLIYL